MTRARAVFLDVLVAVLGLVGAVLSWRHGVHHTVFAAAGNRPAFQASSYHGPWLLLAIVLVVVAGAALIELVVRVIPTAGKYPAI